ncbi:MAG: AMP-dependent synthetase/ligase [Alphaproteobacteria bacterium]
MNDFVNLGELLIYQAKKFNNPQAFNFKEHNHLRSFSNQQFAEQIHCFARALQDLGLKKKQSLAIYCYQNPIWLIADFATIIAGGVSVPIFHNIAHENLLYQLKDSEVKYVFTDNPDISKILHQENFDLKIISYGFKDENSIAFEELIKTQELLIKQHDYQLLNLVKNINSQDLATIIYTSGSTGMPKGVRITHHNLISQIKDCQQFFPFGGDEIALSFLPLAHIFERMVMCYYISCGISVYFVDDIKKISNFLQEFKPNLMTCVPRVLEKVYAKIVNGVDDSSFIKKIIAKKAIKFALQKEPLAERQFFFEKIISKIFDLMVFKKFRNALGGRMQMIICGSASLLPELEKFYWNIGVKIYCGYGLTESSPVITANCPQSFKLGTVGKAFPSVKIKIADDHELLATGANIMQGYHHLDQETKLTIVDNYLKTGDLAEIDHDGFVKIIGRKKDLFKTSNGKYVYPVVIEQKLVQELGFLIGALVIAQNRQFVSALLFPEIEMVEKLKIKLKFKGDNQQFYQSKILNDFIESKISLINNQLDNWQQVKKFLIITQPISISSHEITPSMKLRRNIIENKFFEQINNIYS